MDEQNSLEAALNEARGKIQRQAEELHTQHVVARVRNQQLDALHLVWCSGGCERGVHRYTDKPVTEELVAEAVRNTSRLVQWYISHAAKHSGQPVENWPSIWEKTRAELQVAVAEAYKREP